MSDSPVFSAVKEIVREDEMPQIYEDRLTALIKNAMSANFDDSDIEDILEIIVIEGIEDGD